MARQIINIGTNANDGTGDPLRTAFDKINDNFVELYGSDNDINTLDSNLDVRTYSITTTVTNGDITVTPNGTGNINLGSLKFNGTSISSDDSTIVNINEALRVEGALTATGAIGGASLVLASGATVTELSIDGTLAGNSDSAVPTEKAVKTYVDSQVTAQDLDFQGDTGGALAVDLDSQTFTIAGGTGIDTAGSGQTLTVNIDSTVATLTGSQTLTNKTLTAPTINGATMTGSVTIDNLIFNDTDISTSSDANLNLNPGGTGTVELQANTNVTGTLGVSGVVTLSDNASVAGTLTTADITTTGTQTITGVLNVDGVQLKDNEITASRSDDNLNITASGTGVVNVASAMTTIGQTVTGTVSVTGQLNTDNIRIDGNTISSTSGGINLTPLTGQTVAITNAQISDLSATLAEITTLRTDKIQSDTSDADILIDTQGTGVIDFRTATQSTVGSAGGANALPATPSGYLEVKISGTSYVIPYYAKS